MSTIPDDSTVEEGEHPGMSESDRHWILSNERRRTTLAVMEGRSMPIELDTMAREIANLNRDTATVGEEAVDRLAIALHHNHLPMLADLGVITYDPEKKRVVKCSNLSGLTS